MLADDKWQTTSGGRLAERVPEKKHESEATADGAPRQGAACVGRCDGRGGGGKRVAHDKQEGEPNPSAVNPKTASRVSVRDFTGSYRLRQFIYLFALSIFEFRTTTVHYDAWTAEPSLSSISLNGGASQPGEGRLGEDEHTFF
eukprot:1178079-Prorocentrum_minimum.AAC.2